MDVNPGYKLTEIGVIPQQWDLKPLGKLVRSVEYGSSAKSNVTGTVPVLRMGNLQNGKINWADLVYTDDLTEIHKYTLRSGDVLFNRTNTVDLVGKTSIYEGHFPAIFAGYLIRINVIPELLESRYLNYILNTQFARKHGAKVLSIAVGQANINGQKLKTYPIPLPPTKAEQEAIAGALSDADALIEALEQLIAKKRQIKHGAMQELLTGRRRLPGFSKNKKTKLTDRGLVPADWIVEPVGSAGEVRSGKALASRGPGEQRPYLRTKNVFDGRIDLTDILYMPMIDSDFARYSLKYGDVLLNEGQSLELVGRCAMYRGECPEPCAIQNQLVRFRAGNRACPLFFAYLFQYCQKTGVFAQIAMQTTSVAHLGISRFERLKLAWPSDLGEQEAIATFLEDIDSGLDHLESKLSKARRVKLGMMQALLTGRIRLK